MPPEILEGSGRRKYTSSVDVWSLGVVLYICLCGFPRFSDDLRTNENPFGLFDQIRLGRFDYPSPYWDQIKDPALEFLDQMLTVNVASRIKVDEAMLHPWISGVEGSILSDLHTSGISRPTFFTRRSAQDRTLLTEAFMSNSDTSRREFSLNALGRTSLLYCRLLFESGLMVSRHYSI